MQRLHSLSIVLAAFVATLCAGLDCCCAQAVGGKASSSVAGSLQPFVNSHTLAGAVTLVASKDKVLSLEAVGYADVAAKKPMRTDCLFWIASMTKPMTATALMMLVDEGKLKLDDPVEKYLPEFTGQMVVVEQDADHVLLKKPSHPITIKNVLSHTSGLPFAPRVEPKIDMFPLRESAVIYALTPLRTQPDTKYQYSNAGINIAGRLIELLGGMPYEEFMEKRLFGPLGMKDTTFWPTEQQLGRLAKSYKPNADKTDLAETAITQFTYPLTDRKRAPCPAGGLFSTATDVSLFGRMILNGGVYEGKRYVSEDAVRQMTSTQTGDLLSKGGDQSGYGLGWTTTAKAPGSADAVLVGACGHGGAYATDLWLDPQNGLVMVFMVQHAGYPGPDGKKILPAFRKAAADAFAN